MRSVTIIDTQEIAYGHSRSLV